MSRLPMLEEIEMSGEQKRVYEEIRDPVSKKLKGASSIWIYQPALAKSTYELMELLNRETSVRQIDYHLIPLVVSRRFHIPLMWGNHARSAVAKGVPAEAVEAINRGAEPSLPDAESLLVYRLAQALADRRAVPDDLFREAKEALGQDKITEIATVFGAYTMIGTLFLCFDMKPVNTGFSLAKEYRPPVTAPSEALWENRMDPLDPGQLNEEQKKLYERIGASRGGVVAGPQIPRLRLPKLSEKLQEINDLLRSGSTLPRTAFEWITLAVARTYGADYMWQAHVRDGKKAGLSEEAIGQLQKGEIPEGLSETDRLILDLATELLKPAVPPMELFERGMKTLSAEKMVELASDVGYYGLAAATINAFNITRRTQPEEEKGN